MALNQSIAIGAGHRVSPVGFDFALRTLPTAPTVDHSGLFRKTFDEKKAKPFPERETCSLQNQTSPVPSFFLPDSLSVR